MLQDKTVLEVDFRTHLLYRGVHTHNQEAVFPSDLTDGRLPPDASNSYTCPISKTANTSVWCGREQEPGGTDASFEPR